MFGRRRRRGGKHANPVGRESATGQADPDRDHQGATADRPGADGLPPSHRSDGPWDQADSAPQMPRVDLGSLLVPVTDELQVQLNVVQEEIVAVTITYGSTTLQLQAFAAPKSGDLWADARQEITSELASSDRGPAETDGPFGTEVRAQLPIQTERGVVPQPARFVGVDGPRWLLRGVFTAADSGHSRELGVLENVFRQTVVVRGEEPMPPRERLPLQAPTDEEESAATDEESDPSPPYASGWT